MRWVAQCAVCAVRQRASVHKAFAPERPQAALRDRRSDLGIRLSLTTGVVTPDRWWLLVSAAVAALATVHTCLERWWAR